MSNGYFKMYKQLAQPSQSNSHAAIVGGETFQFG